MITMNSHQCGMCGEEFDSNCDVPSCPTCDAVRCPCCKTWFDRS